MNLRRDSNRRRLGFERGRGTEAQRPEWQMTGRSCQREARKVGREIRKRGGGFEIDGLVEFAQGRGPRSRVRRRWSKRRWGWEVVIGRSGRDRAHDPAFSG